LKLLILLALAGLMQATRSFAEPGYAGPGAVALGLGFTLLAAFFAGGVFKSIGLPRLTGYIVAGIVSGPSMLALLSPAMVGDLRIFNGVAVALIALSAGTELELARMRPLLRTIGWLTLTAVIGTALLLGLTVYLARDLLPFLGALPPVQALAVSFTLGAAMAAQSPAVVVALRDETRADGPLVRTVLGVVVLADLVVIVLFALLSTLATATFGASADLGDTLATLTWELFGSIGVGAGVGLLLRLYLGAVEHGAALFVVTVAFVIAEVGQRVHLDPLLVALAAGVLVRNLTRMGDTLHGLIETSSLPVYVVFFAITGAGIHLDVLTMVGLPAVILVAVRAAGLIGGARLGARLAGAPPVVRRWVGLGLLPQAGLALALALLFAKAFPVFGEQAAALLLGVVAINEIVAPVLYRYALVRSGEAGAAPAGHGALDSAVEEPSLPDYPAMLDVAAVTRDVAGPDLAAAVGQTLAAAPEGALVGDRSALVEAAARSAQELAPGVILAHTEHTAVGRSLAVVGVGRAGFEGPAGPGGLPPAHVLFLVLDPPGRDATRHLRTLAAVARIIELPATIASIRGAESDEELLRLLRDHAG
jgi:Kef-type K+ transport system membrane component KefB/mannitol/fructose-specific phosphotransferase system IIA component (Ntr-type)